MEVWQQLGTPVTTLNLFEEIHLNNKKDNWHNKQKNVQHVSQGTTCGKKAALSQVKPIPFTIRTLGTFEVGNVAHKWVQDRYVLRWPVSVVEFPVMVTVYVNEKVKFVFKITGKIDILDIGNSRIIDIKSSNANAMRWIRTGSKKNPPGAKKSHVIQVLVYWYIWNYKIIRDPKSPYWIKECGISYINKDTYEDIYCPIPLDKYDFEKIFDEFVEQAIGVHKAVNLDDWVYLDNNWHYDPNHWLCKGYCNYVPECKRTIH